MNTYQKIFGSGPVGSALSLFLLYLTSVMADQYDSLRITESQLLRYTLFAGFSLITLLIIIWSIKSLPPADRGVKLVTGGAYKYFRHPLYGAFLSFFNFGLAILLNNWLYIVWAVIQHPIWHLVIKGEEKLMAKEFPEAYNTYALGTGRFFPKFQNK